MKVAKTIVGVTCLLTPFMLFFMNDVPDGIWLMSIAVAATGMFLLDK